MSNITIAILLFVLTAAALFIVSVINHRQTQAKIISQKLAQMKRKVSELEELSATIEPLLESNKVSKLILDEAIAITQNMLKASPGNSFFMMTADALEQRSTVLSDPSTPIEVFRMMESDAAIARAQFSLGEAARIVRKQQSEEKVQLAEMETLIQELSWANFMIKITTHIGQGHQAVNRGDIFRAFAYYRKALEVATESGQKDDRQSQLISEIGDILNNKRKALSENLMPETLHNPSESAEPLTAPEGATEDTSQPNDTSDKP